MRTMNKMHPTSTINPTTSNAGKSGRRTMLSTAEIATHVNNTEEPTHTRAGIFASRAGLLIRLLE